MFSGKSGFSGHSNSNPAPNSGDQQAPAANSEMLRNATIARLSSSPLLDDLSWPGLRSVVAFRILAICSRAGRDPLTELGRRFRSVPAARAFLELADLIGRYWPENVSVCRPCSRALSPDEATFADMIDSARDGDRMSFGQALEGFVRTERHDELFAATVQAVSQMDLSDWQGCRDAR